MADSDGKKPSPPYVSYPSFKGFIKGLGETHVPSRIDKTVMANYSGSTIYALLPSLQWLGLIDEHGNPQPLLSEIAHADDASYRSILEKLAKDKYSFLFNGKVDLSKASNGQVIEAFKSQDISGSTIAKCMSFFLAMAKDAGISVSQHVKAPHARRAPSGKKKKQQTGNKADAGSSEAEQSSQNTPPEGTEKISFSLRGKPDVVVYFPEGLKGEEAKQVITATMFNLKMYYGLLGETLEGV